MHKSSRGAVDPFIVMDMMEAARAEEAKGRHIIHMEVGQPGTGAPKGAVQAVSKALGKDPLGYTVALGLPELRGRIAQLYGDWYNVDLDPERVVVTPGSSGAFLLSFTALFDNDARVGIGAPGYPSYRQILKAVGLEPVVIEASAAAGYQLTPADIADARLDGLMMASPANPTGTMLDRTALAAITNAAQSTGTAFISDEIYHGIEYEKKAVSALEISDDVYVINSFSKYFSMTGWRVGWMVVPPEHVRVVERIAQNLFICAPHAAQVAALAALDCREELAASLDVYRRNRDLMIAGLAASGFNTIAPPDGAFYIYADVSAYTQNSFEFAGEILREAGVAVAPGLDFDARRGGSFLRFSYARSTADIVEGLDRLARFMQRRS